MRYHKYKDIWVTTKGEQLLCQRENDNIHNPFTVAVIKNDYVVDHMPKKISTTCLLFCAYVILLSENRQCLIL